MPESASDQTTPPVAGAEESGALVPDAPMSVDQLMEAVASDQESQRVAGHEKAVHDAIRETQDRNGDLKATFSERNAETGQVEQFDVFGNKVAEGEHPASGQPQDPDTATAAEPPAAAPAAPDPRQSASAEEHHHAQIQHQIDQLRASVDQARDAPLNVKPDFSDEPNWDDENQFPTMKDAQEARRKWYEERYAAAVTAAQTERSQTIEAQAASVQHAAAQAEGARIHAAVQKRLGLDDAGYREAVARYGELTHPDYNAQFKMKNPVGSGVITALARHEGDLRKAGVDAKGHDGPIGMHEAQVGDPDFARKVASLPISQETANLIESVSHQPKSVAVLRHLVSDAGAADRNRLLQPGTPATVAEREVYRIAAGLSPAVEKAAAPAAAPARPAAPAAKPVQTIPTPGRSQPSRAPVEDLGTSEGTNAMFDRLLKEADKNGTNGWGYM